MRRIRKNDMVMIIAGKDKGKTGRVIRVIPSKNAVLVEQANLVKKHQKPSQKQPTGGIVDIESPIDLSNVMLLDGKTGKGTRVKVAGDKDGAKVRVAAKSGTVFD
jgi:large subunit ribosomal protein L24